MRNENGTSASCSTLHVRGYRDRRELRQFDRAFSHDVAAQDRAKPAVGDQLAESGAAAVDERARQRVEALGGHDDVVGLSRRGFGESDGGVFRVGEAAERTHLGWKRGCLSEYGVRGRQVCLAHRFVDDHQLSGDVPSGEAVRGGRAEPGVDPDVAALVELDAGSCEVEVSGVRDPTHRDNCEGLVDDASGAVGRVGHSDPGRGRLEALDRSGVVEDLDPGRSESGADRRGDIVVFTHQDPGSGLVQRDL